MALSEGEVVDTAKALLALREQEQRRLKKISAYVAGRQDSVYVPKGARQEYRWLIRRARVNIMPLVVTVVAQSLFVDGYRPERSETNAEAWKYWQANRMDGRQHGLHRAVLKYGVAYTLVLPGELNGQPMPKITPKSPRRMTAFYGDPVEDEWPQFAVEVVPEMLPGGKWGQAVYLYDEVSRYRLVGDGKPHGQLDFAKSKDSVMEHQLEVCPVVRYLNGDDLDGDECVRGEVEPLYDMQDQLNSTTFSRMMAEQYAAFRQRWASGMVAEDEQGRSRAPFESAVDRLWTSDDPDTKFGEFGATDLSGYLKSAEETIRHIATVSQTPPHNLLGEMANLSAEALNAARDGLNSKVAERKSTTGESHEQTLRLAARAAGDDTGWRDLGAQVVWRDTESRSLAATVDALGKLATMLKVPVEVLWERIPGITQQDVARWQAAAEKGDALTQLNGIVDAQKAALMAGAGAPGPARVPAAADARPA